MENVPLAARTPAYARFVEALEEAGYRWTAGILNAALHGSCQCRQRLIFIGIREDAGESPTLPPPTHGGRKHYFNYSQLRTCTVKQEPTALLGITPATFQVRGLLPHTESSLGQLAIPTVGEVLAGLPPVGSKAAVALSHVPWGHTAEQKRKMGRLIEGGQARRSSSYYSQSYGRLHRRGFARTITGAFPNAGSGRNWHPTENRSITLREAARIQGFPDSFRFSAPLSKSALMVGNALDAALANVTLTTIKAALS
jgi:DNA (cytosine-5)-methyltransferase 1